MTQDSGRRYRDVMGNFCSGVVVVTALKDNNPIGLTAQSFVALSIDPELIALCPAMSSNTWPGIRKAGRFCINVLAEDQQHVSSAFARSGTDKFADVQWSAGSGGSPVIQGSICHIDCELEREVEAGDHLVAIGKVVDMQLHRANVGPLLFFRGQYGSLA
ncbi:flavin reductase family protein [Parahaliea mediterranea]|uniref:Flavin reductase family protein n=1 Tax=Parahaliea mediterranea TaxID=651086 RepID=A0A939DHB4_9GAMM|nr:flavin reductase family protein [Parahaliea mediterranea]MBN7797512.1 flavin reductase family protein [Parahaliea mediterranea]